MLAHTEAVAMKRIIDWVGAMIAGALGMLVWAVLLWSLVVLLGVRQ